LFSDVFPGCILTARGFLIEFIYIYRDIYKFILHLIKNHQKEISESNGKGIALAQIDPGRTRKMNVLLFSI